MKKIRGNSWIFGLLFVAFAAGSARADDLASADLKLVPSGISKKVGFYNPRQLQLSPEKPAGLTKAPPLSAPLYGSLNFGGKEYLVALDAPADKDPRLYVDANGNGDLTDDAPVAWTKHSGPGGPSAFYEGDFTLPLATSGGSTSVTLSVYRFGKDDPRYAQLKTSVFYYRDYGYAGQITLNGAKYDAILLDNAAAGDFGATAAQATPGPQLLIDLDGSGKYNNAGKTYNAFQPFNIKGATWQLSSAWPNGPFTISKSDVSVAEIPLAPDLSVGKPAVPFTAQTMDGKNVEFPSDFKGKLVLLDFWATWCGPCMGEVPGLVKAYPQYQSKGVEFLGVSLDQANQADHVKQVMAQQGMTWPQIYDGKYWSSRVGQMYGIESIPHPLLIDGDTGKILAEGGSLRGDALTKTLDDALAARAANGVK